MGYNIAGLVIKGTPTQETLEALLGDKYVFEKEIDFEEASSSQRPKERLDVLQTGSGVFLLFDLMDGIHPPAADLEIIHFIISDVSDTYYLDKYEQGELVSHMVISEGEIVEESGEAIFDPEEDLEDFVFDKVAQYLQLSEGENIWDATFNRNRYLGEA